MRFAVVHPSVHSKDPDAARALQWFRSVGARRMAVLLVVGVQTNADVERMVAD